MKREDMEQLPESEINRIAMKKNANGIATKDAKLAQRIMYERLHWPCATAPSQHYDGHGNKYTKTGVRYGDTYDQWW